MPVLELVHANREVEKACTSDKAALRLFGGNKKLVKGLLSRVQALKAAETIRDIINMPLFHFHALHDKGNDAFGGQFAIDLAGRREPWRLILQPLDDCREPFVPCHIDEISEVVRIVRIGQVSKHYE